jgi:hypothetical protein
MFGLLFNQLAALIASCFNAGASGHNDFQIWLLDKAKRLLDLVYSAQNAWMWVLTAVAVIAGMFVDVADWIANAFNAISITGITAPAGTIFAPTASFSSAYGFLDACFPVHEVLSGLVFLMPLFLAINIVRLTRAVLSIIQINGWGVNN